MLLLGLLHVVGWCSLVTCGAEAFSASTPSAATIKTTATTSNEKPVNQEDTKILQTMREIHDKEVARGVATFVKSPSDDSDSTETPTITSWNDDHFRSRHLGDRNAGTDALLLTKGGDEIFETLGEQIVTDEECAAIIAEAQETIAQGLKEDAAAATAEDGENSDNQQERARARTNSQLGEATLSSMPKARAWLQGALKERFLPILQDRFGVDHLTLYDGLVLGAQAPSRSQPIHRDACLLTLNVALTCPTNDYQGGGTYIEALDETLTIPKGQLLCHAGGAMHAGVGITQGERWVLVLFVLGRDHDQMARRCHAQALDYMQQNLVDEAERVLQTGLAVAPKDHLLHNTMGRVHLMRNHLSLAMQSFEQADAAYPICQKALVSTAQIMLDRRRPRAALRRFDRVLERIADRDLRPDSMMSLKALTFAARRDAARCALLCAEHDARQSDRAWSCQYLPVAIARMKTCLDAAPNDPNLRGMFQRAEVLLAEAQGSTMT